jgi:predicted small integral membrane protein
MRALLLVATILAPVAAPIATHAQQAGWGNLNKEPAAKGFSWTQPLFDGFWMAWTPATIAFFVFIFACIALMGLLEWRSPGGAPRHGAFGLDTTRGDRLFISLLGAAYVFMLWLALLAAPLWGALALAILWTAFVFWKV